MSKTELFGFEVEIYRDLNEKWYSTSSGWACSCGHCRNFLTLAHDKKLPSDILESLYAIGISPHQATYVCEMYPDGDKFMYQFSYRISGMINSEDLSVHKKYDWGDVRFCHEPYPYGAPDFPVPNFDLEFWVPLPWILDEDPDGR